MTYTLYRSLTHVHGRELFHYTVVNEKIQRRTFWEDNIERLISNLEWYKSNWDFFDTSDFASVSPPESSQVAKFETLDEVIEYLTGLLVLEELKK